jgi:4-amino-4-deoxy-L-arabinose transferase-like glycosyltransferase
VLIAAAIAVSFIVRHNVFGAYSWNRDEPVYLWQARALRAGHLTTTDGGAPAFFQPWLVGTRAGSFFSQYTPGWPTALALSAAILGSAGYALAFASALCVTGMYVFTRELTSDRVLATVAAALMTLSPILVVQSGMYLGYLFTLGVGLCAATCLLSGLRRSRRWLVVGSGVLLGVIFVTRPFDAVLWALPFALYLALTRRRDWRQLLGATGWVILGLLPLLIVGLAYNHHVTGAATQFPITAVDRHDTFGFGVRSIMPRWTPVNYTVARAVRGTGRNLFFLPEFLVGSFFGIALAAVGLWLRRRDRSTIALVALGVVFPIGYFFFWGIYLSGAEVTLTGPLYDIPLYAPLCVLIATTLLAAWRWRRVVAFGVLIVLVGATTWALVDKLGANRDISRAQLPWRTSTAHLGAKSLVFVDRAGPYLIQLNPYSANTTDINGPIVYAIDRGPDDLALIAERNDRVPYLQSTNLTPRNPPSTTVPTITMTRLRVVQARTVTFHARIANRTGAPVVMAYLQVGNQRETRTLDTASRKGMAYDVTWTVGVGPPGPAALVPFTDQLGTATVGTETAPAPGHVPDPDRWEQQFPYRLLNGEAQLLAPGRGQRIRVKGTKVRIDPANTARELKVDLNPVGA